MDSRFLVTITSWSFALSSSLMPRFPTANDSHSGYSLVGRHEGLQTLDFTLRTYVWFQQPADCRTSVICIQLLAATFHRRSQISACRGRQRGGENKSLNNNYCKKKILCCYRQQTVESREDTARKSSGVSVAVLLFSNLSRWMWHISSYILSGNTDSQLQDNKWKIHISSCFLHLDSCTLMTSFRWRQQWLRGSRASLLTETGYFLPLKKEILHSCQRP